MSDIGFNKIIFLVQPCLEACNVGKPCSCQNRYVSSTELGTYMSQLFLPKLCLHCWSANNLQCNGNWIWSVILVTACIQLPGKFCVAFAAASWYLGKKGRRTVVAGLFNI